MTGELLWTRSSDCRVKRKACPAAAGIVWIIISNDFIANSRCGAAAKVMDGRFKVPNCNWAKSAFGRAESGYLCEGRSPQKSN
jgi:hypothetical protein